VRIPDSLFTRRRFLGALIGGWLLALVAAVLGPLRKFIIPPYREPDEVTLPLADYASLGAGEMKPFAWGIKPGFLRRTADGAYVALVGVCTHLDCNVTWLPEQSKFFCACHEGWYDENGRNIAGPPPKPLRRLETAVEGENLIVRKTGAGR